MKRFFVLVFASLCFTFAFAEKVTDDTQSADSAQTVKQQYTFADWLKRGYNRAMIGYPIGFVNWNTTDGPFSTGVLYNIHGITLGYTRGFALTNSQKPHNLYVELGVNASYMQSNADLGYYFDATKQQNSRVGETPIFRDLVRVFVPLSLTYKWTSTNGLSFAPYAGVDFIANVYSNYERYSGDITTVQGDWHAGLNFAYRHIAFSAEYSQDINTVADNIKIGQLLFRIGYEF